jgi:hypothetical protein
VFLNMNGNMHLVFVEGPPSVLQTFEKKYKRLCRSTTIIQTIIEINE